MVGHPPAKYLKHLSFNFFRPQELGADKNAFVTKILEPHQRAYGICCRLSGKGSDLADPAAQITIRTGQITVVLVSEHLQSKVDLLLIVHAMYRMSNGFTLCNRGH